MRESTALGFHNDYIAWNKGDAKQVLERATALEDKYPAKCSVIDYGCGSGGRLRFTTSLDPELFDRVLAYLRAEGEMPSLEPQAELTVFTKR